MDRKKAVFCLVAVTFYLHAVECRAQEPLSPLSQVPTGFMIEGLLSANFYVTPDGVSIVNAAAVPAVVVGYKLPSVAIGLGLSFHRTSYIQKDEMSDYKRRDTYTSMLFAPRFEITLVRKVIAEAYLVASFGAGFNDVRNKVDGPGVDRTEADYGPVLGALLGLGGRCFFGGGPFALGMEFGWSGLFININDEENDEKTWLNIMGFYGALVGTFVFG